MFKKITFKKIFLFLFIVIIICQFFTIDKTNAEFDPEHDFIKSTSAPDEISKILKSACYDCHSNEVKYPWYTNIAPFSWWIKHHVNEGVEELNFSNWGKFKGRKKDRKLKEAIELIEKEEMPLNSYTWLHSEANLSNEQKQKLILWFTGLRSFESEKPKEN